MVRTGQVLPEPEIADQSDDAQGTGACQPYPCGDFSEIKGTVCGKFGFRRLWKGLGFRMVRDTVLLPAFCHVWDVLYLTDKSAVFCHGGVYKSQQG